MIFQSAIHFVKNILHSIAPFSDHKLITIKLGDQQVTTSLRGYWKMNNALLKDESFNNSIKDHMTNERKTYGNLFQLH